MGTFETLQPWFVESWRRQKARCFATLDALGLYKSLMGPEIDLPGTVNASLEVFLAGLRQQEGEDVA